MPVEVKRLVVEEASNTLAVDFHAGLTIAFHENPVVRNRCLADLLDALGAGRPGLHLELIDHERHHLAVFRPHGGQHRVIDIDTATDVSATYRARGDRVDVLGRLGIDPDTAARMLRVGARQIDRAPDTGTDNHRDARRLAAAEPADLWDAATELHAAETALAAAERDLPGADLDAATAFERIATTHDSTAAALATHRPVQRLGVGVSAACLLVGAALLAFDENIGDNGFTGRILVVLGLLAAVVTAIDRFAMRAARRTEKAVLREAGATGYADAAARAGTLAEADRRHALMGAATRHDATRRRWVELAGQTSASWALAHRPAIEALAAQKGELRRVGAEHLANDDSGVADSARVLVDKIIHLQEVGTTREQLPLLLDEPFVGQAPIDVQRLLSTLHRMARQHQIVLVTGDPYVQAWATEGVAASSVGFVRLGRAPGTDVRDDAAPDAGAVGIDARLDPAGATTARS